MRADRPTLGPDSCIVLARHAKLRFDKTRDRWILLVPEKVMVPDDICAQILQLCDGQQTVADISATMAQKYVAEPGVIEAEVLTMLQDLAQNGLIVLAPIAPAVAAPTPTVTR